MTWRLFNPVRPAQIGAGALICAMALVGCADLEHAGWLLVTTGKPALMRMGGQQLEGDVELRPDRTGSVHMRGKGSITSCAGALRFTAARSGSMDLLCSDGALLAMQFALVNEVKGYAFGIYQDATVALTFGMDTSESQGYLAQAQNPAPMPAAITSATTP